MPLTKRHLTRDHQDQADLKVVYNPNDIVQVYYKKIQTSKLTLAALVDPVTNVEMMRHAFGTFEVHMQVYLKEACRNLERQMVAPTWARMMTHFSIEIQWNQTNLSKMKRQGKANAVLQQVEQQHLQTECMVAQTESVQRLQEQLVAVQFEQ